MTSDNTIIKLENITKSYGDHADNSVVALGGVTLHVHRGEFIAIMGASGSGKSTLMNILGLLDIPTTGTYLLDGKEIQKSSGKELAKLRNKHFGFVYQSFNLLKRTTVMKNVELPLIYNPLFRGNRTEKVRAALQEVGLSHRLKHRPNELSGGEQQRVAIARALINDPSILLADEPTGNLDSKNGAQIIQLLLSLHARGKTIILVTHSPELGELAHRLITIKDGRVLSERRK